MATPGVIQLLLDERDRLIKEVEQLRNVEVDVHVATMEVAVLRERLAGSVLVDVLFTCAFGIAVALLGVVSTIWQAHPNGAKLVLAFALVLLVFGLAVKVFQTVRQRKKST